METVATGTPGGICTVDSSASSPFSAEESTGTPITGAVVCAATTPARCAAAPAPTIKTFTPRAGASRTSRMTRSGERCADATVVSDAMPRSRNTSTAPCITGASESEPIRIRTDTFIAINAKIAKTAKIEKASPLAGADGFPRDVLAILHPVEADSRNTLIGATDGFLEIIASCHDSKYSTACCDEPAVLVLRPRVKHHHILELRCLVDSSDWRSRAHRARVAFRGHDHANMFARAELGRPRRQDAIC